MTNQGAIEKIQSTVCTDEGGCVCRNFPECLTNPSVCEYALAVKALGESEGQTAKKICRTDYVGIDGTPYELCPGCMRNLCTYGVYQAKPSYCKWCGQKLDWSD